MHIHWLGKGCDLTDDVLADQVDALDYKCTTQTFPQCPATLVEYTSDNQSTQNQYHLVLKFILYLNDFFFLVCQYHPSMSKVLPLKNIETEFCSCNFSLADLSENSSVKHSLQTRFATLQIRTLPTVYHWLSVHIHSLGTRSSIQIRKVPTNVLKGQHTLIFNKQLSNLPCEHLLWPLKIKNKIEVKKNAF